MIAYLRDLRDTQCTLTRAEEVLPGPRRIAIVGELRANEAHPVSHETSIYYERTHVKNVYNCSQNAGLANVAWYDVCGTPAAGAAGMLEVSSTRGISTIFSPCDGESEGEGESTTDGMRLCPERVLLCVGSGNRVICPPPAGFCNVGSAIAGVVFAGSQSKPGLTIKLIVSPSFTLYSCKSLPSASAFPLRRSRCASANGAPGSKASCALIAEMVSVGCTDNVYD